MAADLTVIWAAIIAFGVFMYVFMDGFDLGVGILFPFARSDRHRDLMMNSVAPIWDGNETWLVLGGAGLLAAFPLAYAIILPALYIPLTVMLLALIFRGVAFEFRFKAEASRPLWDRAFNLGSLVATGAQGIVLGAFIQGFAVDGRDYVGGMFDWLTPFSLMTGVGLVAGYALLGSAWLVMKTEADLQAWAYGMARPLLFGVLIFIAIVSLWTPLLDRDIAGRWFSWPNIAYLSPIPILTALLAFGLYRALELHHDRTPFVYTLGLFVLSYGGLAISLWPYVIPPDITIWEAASSPTSQIFLLAGAAFVIPAILAYTAWSYYVFRGKVRQDIGYH
ncbi:cytochrome d ubiquinol oxidase subunit II [Rhodospirillaceae bacterium SYSU D60014]|uniref:cytochrome d ubiquinol oxidase subunit II n=1 Tax=Virgifigura deserti TaxID=2268457 RepID=UPI000E669BE8